MSQAKKEAGQRFRTAWNMVDEYQRPGLVEMSMGADVRINAIRNCLTHNFGLSVADASSLITFLDTYKPPKEPGHFASIAHEDEGIRSKPVFAGAMGGE